MKLRMLLAASATGAPYPGFSARIQGSLKLDDLKREAIIDCRLDADPDSAIVTYPAPATSGDNCDQYSAGEFSLTL